MFKKVQLKFFAITTSILLAIFIAVLASINLIMEAVMQRQSKVVLKQIASSIEYDEKTSSFTYYPEPLDKMEPPDDHSSAPDPSQSKKGTDITATDPTEYTSDSSTETQPVSSDDSNQSKTTVSDKTDNSDQSDHKGTASTAVSSDDDSETSDTDTAPAGTASPSKASNDQTSTQPATGSQSPDAQARPQEEEPEPSDNEYPLKEQYPPYDWDGEYPWKDDYQNYDGNWNNDFYDHPMPDERFDPYWKNEWDSYQDDTNIERESFSGVDDSGFIMQVSGKENTVLNGYTIIGRTPKTVFMSDGAAATRNAQPVPKSLGSIDFFVLMADKNGNLIGSLNNDNLQDDIAQKYINAIINDGASSGMLNSYQFCKLTKDNGTIMVFTDKSAELDMLSQLTRTTILIGVISFILLSVLAFFLSKKSIKPIKIAFEKQKQFVSDASHELKTPLTVISANADVLAGEIGENKWLTYIKAQTERMNVLVNDLLNLTRLENNTSDFICTEFNLSNAIENTALPFECQAFESQKVFDIDIQEGLTINGSERHIKQMAAIFIDNALKYSNNGGTVRITLKSQGDKKILSVFNTGSGIKDDEKNKIFERFYRSDDSRARATGGYGLGLAIAKSIIDKHKFKVSVDNVEGECICFNVIM